MRMFRKEADARLAGGGSWTSTSHKTRLVNRHSASSIEPPVSVDRKHTFCDSVLESLEPLIVRDADAEPRWRKLPGKLLVGTRSYASVPIVLGDGRVFGTLCAHDRRVLDLRQSEIDAMRILARMIASQIERDEALSKEAESARHLARQNEELTLTLQQIELLREAVETISSELEIDAVLKQVVASGVALLGAHPGAISLLGEDVEAPRRWVATYNLDVENLTRRGIPARAGLMGEVLARRGPVIVGSYDDVAAEAAAGQQHSRVFGNLGRRAGRPAAGR